ncbi:basic salivary proline-rich protein 2-like [Nyctibius grandis]|uniref:basic salivary proline-rich protein 2-like n=1 Tax=Nyctibius grandis TaxID=48427 RepID=UPI0035BC21D4
MPSAQAVVPGSTWKQQATTSTARPRRGKAGACPVNQRRFRRSPAQPGTGRPHHGGETPRLRYMLRTVPGTPGGFKAGRAEGTRRDPLSPRPGSRGAGEDGPSPAPPACPRTQPGDPAGPGPVQAGAVSRPRSHRHPRLLPGGSAPRPRSPAQPGRGDRGREGTAPGGRRGQGRDTPVTGRRRAPSSRTPLREGERRRGSARTQPRRHRGSGPGPPGGGRSRAAQGRGDGADETPRQREPHLPRPPPPPPGAGPGPPLPPTT